MTTAAEKYIIGMNLGDLRHATSMFVVSDSKTKSSMENELSCVSTFLWIGIHSRNNKCYTDSGVTFIISRPHILKISHND